MITVMCGGRNFGHDLLPSVQLIPYIVVLRLFIWGSFALFGRQRSLLMGSTSFFEVEASRFLVPSELPKSFARGRANFSVFARRYLQDLIFLGVVKEPLKYFLYFFLFHVKRE